MKRLGLLINPVAGVGGPAGLKGSDGTAAQRAMEWGYRSMAQERTIQTLAILRQAQETIQLYTFSQDMGEDAARQAGFSPIVLGAGNRPTTASDTMRGTQMLAKLPVDLLLFSGGDGTARDLCRTVDSTFPVLGIPCGVKIHSSVFAQTPQKAGMLALRYLQGELPLTLGEVVDLDEEAYRRGEMKECLYGALSVPKNLWVQRTKSTGYTPADAGVALSQAISREMDPQALCVVGPGSTLYTAFGRLGVEGSLLGVDLVKGNKLLERDCSERKLYEILQKEKRLQLFVTVIGGQGALFGRGNQQLSPRVLRCIGREHVLVVSTKEKLADLRLQPMTLDTGDPDLDREWAGYYRVLLGPCESTYYPAK